MHISLSPFAPENLVSRDGFGSPVPRQLLISILRLNLVLTYGIPPEFRGGLSEDDCIGGGNARQTAISDKRRARASLRRERRAAF